MAEASQRPGRDVRAFLFHLLDQDAPARVGKDQEIKVLKEMNELQEFGPEEGIDDTPWGSSTPMRFWANFTDS